MWTKIDLTRSFDVSKKSFYLNDGSSIPPSNLRNFLTIKKYARVVNNPNNTLTSDGIRFSRCKRSDKESERKSKRRKFDPIPR